MPSYQHSSSHFTDKLILGSSYLNNGIFFSKHLICFPFVCSCKRLGAAFVVMYKYISRRNSETFDEMRKCFEWLILNGTCKVIKNIFIDSFSAIWLPHSCNKAIKVLFVKCIVDKIRPRSSTLWMYSAQWNNWYVDIMQWKRFPHYWPFLRSLVNSPHKRPVMQGVCCFFTVARISCEINSRVAGDSRRHGVHMTPL